MFLANWSGKDLNTEIFSENSNKVMVTVICSTYNHEEYIRSALDGFLMQKTNFEFEVIIHDDASTDNTASIIKEYEMQYPDIIKPIYQKVNQYSLGVNRLFEYILPRARGKYIALCEGDDYWIDENKLQLQVDFMENNPQCSLVVHDAITLHVDGNYFEKFTSKTFNSINEIKISSDEIIRNHMIFTTASMFFKIDYYMINMDFLKTISGFDYVHKILLASMGDVYLIPKVMSVYRKGSVGSWTNRISKSPEKYNEHLEKAAITLKKIDEYTEYRYSTVINQNILKRRFDAYITVKDISSLKKEPYKELYDALPFWRKTYIYIDKYFPMVTNFARTIKKFYKKLKGKRYKY